jgi:hypothetical protein
MCQANQVGHKRYRWSCWSLLNFSNFSHDASLRVLVALDELLYMPKWSKAKDRGARGVVALRRPATQGVWTAKKPARSKDSRCYLDALSLARVRRGEHPRLNARKEMPSVASQPRLFWDYQKKNDDD